MKGVFLSTLAAMLWGACSHATVTQEQVAPAAAAEAKQGNAAGAKGSIGSHSRLERKPKGPGEAIVTSSPAGLLEKEAPRQIQSALNAKGFEVEETGILDKQTTEALRRFQKKEDIAVHGMPDELTIAKLGLDTRKVYRSNAKGDDSKNQKREEEKAGEKSPGAAKPDKSQGEPN